MSEDVIKDPVIFDTKYDVESANELENKIHDEYKNNKLAEKLLIEYPTVYIINSKISGNKEYSVYVGETNDIQRRTIEHLGEDPKVRVDFADFKHSTNAKMYVIGQEHFNKSMTLDIENRLMQYLSSVSAVSRLNNRRFNEQNKYYDSEEFDDLFKRIWSELHKKDENLFPDAEDLKTKAIFKSSPFNKLTNEQLKVKTEVIFKIDQALRSATSLDEAKLILVEGKAGTGKTVLVSNIFYDLIHEDRLDDSSVKKKTNHIHHLKITLLVNQNEQLKVYEEIAAKLFPNDSDIKVLKPATFIRKTTENNKDDIVIIDEAHLLLTQKSQAYYGHGDKMIDDILKRARVVVAVFDPQQVLSIDSIIDNRYLETLVEKTGGEITYLKDQLRIDANDQTIEWIHRLIDEGTIGPIPKDRKYEIKIFDSPMLMQNAIEQKNHSQVHGISRMVATFDWKYSGGKEELPEKQRYWEVRTGNWSMPWNYEINRRDHIEKRIRYKDKEKNLNKSRLRTVKYSDLPWAEKDYTINEIGSLYTVQGFDLNYVGVILGPSVKYRDGKIIHDYQGSENRKAINKRNSKKCYAKELLKNEFNVLMTRGVHGLYIYAVDQELQNALKEAAKNNLN